MKRSAQLQQASLRPFRKRIEEPACPGHSEARRVRSGGEIKSRDPHHFRSEALAGKATALKEVEYDLWSTHLGEAFLQRFETRCGRMSLLWIPHRQRYLPEPGSGSRYPCTGSRGLPDWAGRYPSLIFPPLAPFAFPEYHRGRDDKLALSAVSRQVRPIQRRNPRYGNPYPPSA